MNYNGAFFGLLENVFRLLKKEYGQYRTLDLFTQLMETGLSKSYGKNFTFGEPFEFQRLVFERDRVVGLHVEFPEVTNDIRSELDPMLRIESLVRKFRVPLNKCLLMHCK